MSGTLIALIVVGGVFAALLVAELIVLFVPSKKKKDEQPAAQPEEQPEEQTEEQPEEQPVVQAEEQPEEQPEEQQEEQTEEQPEQQPEEQPEEQPVVQAEEQPEEQPEQSETTAVISIPIIASAETSDQPEEKVEAKEVVVAAVGEGTTVRYNRSFLAKLIQSDEALQSRYGAVKNELLSYKKVKTRIGWYNETVRCGRLTVAKFGIKGKTLYLYLAIDPATLENTKYFYKDVGEIKRYNSVPTRIKLRSNRSVKYAAELIAQMFEARDVKRVADRSVDYSLPYESTEKLIERNLIKLVVSKGGGFGAFAANAEAAVAEKEEPSEEPKPVDESTAEKLQEVGVEVRESVTVTEAQSMITDEDAAKFIEVVKPQDTEKTGKKFVINVDTLSANFEAGDVVDLATLKEKRLVPKNVGYIKVLARGAIDKPLTVKAQDYSMDAVKMIIMVGGKVIEEK